MKKNILIILFAGAVLLIAVGGFIGIKSFNAKNKEIVDAEKNMQEQQNQDDALYVENVHVYRTIEDAIYFLQTTYVTENVEVTYNDGVKATIKVFKDTDDEVSYTYFINGGDLIIN